MFLRKISKQKVEVSLDEALNVDMDGNELLLADIIPTNQTLIMDEVLSNEKENSSKYASFQCPAYLLHASGKP